MVATIVVCMVLTFGTIVDTRSSERVIRVLSVVVGLFIYIGSKALGISLPEVILESIRSVSVGMTILTWGLPSFFVGWFIAWYVTRTLRRRDDDINIRVLLMVTTILVLIFTDTYAQAFGFGQLSGTAFVPNMLFVVGLGLHFIFNYRDNETRNREKS